jgi:hypothetical protein
LNLLLQLLKIPLTHKFLLHILLQHVRNRKYLSKKLPFAIHSLS